MAEQKKRVHEWVTNKNIRNSNKASSETPSCLLRSGNVCDVLMLQNAKSQILKTVIQNKSICKG